MLDHERRAPPTLEVSSQLRGPADFEVSCLVANIYYRRKNVFATIVAKRLQCLSQIAGAGSSAPYPRDLTNWLSSTNFSSSMSCRSGETDADNCVAPHTDSR